MALLLWIAGTIALFADMPQLGIAIYMVNIINGVFSYWQERQASKASEALQHLLPTYARVIRDGRERKVIAQELVVGDIILMSEGDKISADARLIQVDDLQIDQSTLTGESRFVRKQAQKLTQVDVPVAEYTNLVFAGTTVSQGSGKAVVIAIGMDTQFGAIAALTQATKEELSPLQRELNRLTKQISFIAVLLGSVFFLAAVFIVKEPVAQSFIFALGMIVAFIPEGLLPTVTLSLAVAVQRMAKKQALVKKLSAVETLGSTSVICTDKTGTLTQNEMTVSQLYVAGEHYLVSGVGYAPIGDIRGIETIAETIPDYVQFCIEQAALCTNAKILCESDSEKKYQILGDPTEASLVVLAQKIGLTQEQLSRKYPRMRELAFDSVRKRMTTIHEGINGEFASCKGAPREVLSCCRFMYDKNGITVLTQADINMIMAENDYYARQGLRVLAIATRKLDNANLPAQKSGYTIPLIEQELTFLGLIAMSDPPRAEVSLAVQKCHQAGIKIIMMTGDYGLTAQTIAQAIGIADGNDTIVVTGMELAEMTDEQLSADLQKPIIFARMAPEQKLRVVQVLQHSGYVVAMTGDGVNDAPALKKADIGVAMGQNGSDVAKESADMILLDDNFASIVSAIEEGRAVYRNIRKFILYIFSSNVAEAVPSAMFLISKGAIPLPLTIMQILTIDLGTDMLPALGLGVEASEPDVMRDPPRKQSERLLNRALLIKAFCWYGLMEGTVLVLAYFFVNWQNGWPTIPLAAGTDIVYLRATTMALLSIGFCQIGNVLNCRSEHESIIKLGIFSNSWINVGVVVQVILLVAIVYLPIMQSLFKTAPLTLTDWLFLSIWPILIFGFEEMRKTIVRKRMKRGVS